MIKMFIIVRCIDRWLVVVFFLRNFTKSATHTSRDVVIMSPCAHSKATCRKSSSHTWQKNFVFNDWWKKSTTATCTLLLCISYPWTAIWIVQLECSRGLDVLFTCFGLISVGRVSDRLEKPREPSILWMLKYFHSAFFYKLRHSVYVSLAVVHLK